MAMIKTCKMPVLQEKSASGSVASFNTALAMPLASCTSLISGYQEGSGTPSPDNVRPLHAFSSASLGKTGKNLFDKNNSNQILNAYFSGGSIIVESSITKTIYIKCKPNTTYTLSRLAGERFALGYTKVLPSLNVQVYDKIVKNTASSITITTGADAQYLVSYIFNSTVDTDILSDLLDSIQIEENDEATAYEPFGNSYTFTFGQSIYQGSIDWKRGVIVATWGYIASYNGETLTGEWLCNKAPYEAGTTPPTGSQVAYELATPIEIPLGGINLLTQEGQNNIFADTGDVDLTYTDLDIAKRGNFREVFKLPS